jgi:hypothetical protein
VNGGTGERKPWLAQLYTVTGRLAVSEESYDDQFTLDLAGLTPGVYILRLNNGASLGVLTTKVIVE